MTFLCRAVSVLYFCLYLAFCDVFSLHLTVIKRAQQGYEGQAKATSPHAQIRPLANELDIKMEKKKELLLLEGKKK